MKSDEGIKRTYYKSCKGKEGEDNDSKVYLFDHPFFKELSNLAEVNNYIDPKLHLKYNTKRGLRNADGTGVLIGLTEIGEVVAYQIDEHNNKIPQEGQLFYRGIEINDLVEGFQIEKRAGFEEVVYLLLFGELPTSKKLEEFNSLLGELRSLPEGFTEDMILQAPSSNIMNKLARSVLAMYSFDSDPENRNVHHDLRKCIKLIARFPALVAYGYQAKNHFYKGTSLYIHPPRKDLNTAENFLKMIRPDKKFTELEAELLDLTLVLHADHGGGDNSSFTTHVVSSTDTDTYSAISAAVGSLKGTKHGGANIKVIEMMEDLKNNIKNWDDEKEIEDYLAKILRKEAFDKNGLVYGMGHAVYTLSDPRSELLKKKAAKLAEEKEVEKEFNLYAHVENLTSKVFAEVKQNTNPIAANVDFYSGFVYKMLNIPLDLYTPIFAMSRIAGWCAHRIEEIVSGGKIIRPAYKSVVPRAKYIPLKDRG